MAPNPCAVGCRYEQGAGMQLVREEGAVRHFRCQVAAPQPWREAAAAAAEVRAAAPGGDGERLPRPWTGPGPPGRSAEQPRLRATDYGRAALSTGGR